jgi:hypothetical protein
MALARIITHSDQCSRELALDLLARGYAVEIVSPDAIPDNLADLELRVDTDPGNQLVASVESHVGERSASLEFVHHLRAPMVDFVRRPKEHFESGHFPKQPVDINAEPALENVELPAGSPQRTAETPVLKTPLNRDTNEGAPLIASSKQLPLAPMPIPTPAEVRNYFPVGDRTVPRPALVKPTTAKPPTFRPWQALQWRWRDYHAGWHARAAFTFASVFLLAIALGLAMRRPGKSAQSSGSSPAALSPAAQSKGNSYRSTKELPVAKAGVAPAIVPAVPPATISRRREHDLVARDTVTYLDKRFEPPGEGRRVATAEPKQHLARRRPSSSGRDGGVVAANTVTHLNDKSDPTAAK